MKKVSIRPAEESDVEALALLCQELGYPTDAPTTAERLAVLAELAGNAVLVAEEAPGRVVGWVHVFAAHRLESPDFAEIGGLVVTEAMRGEGVGRALVEAVEAWSREAGLDRMRVRSNLVREAAHRFYQGQGYSRLKSQAVFQKLLGAETP